jgi:hypothetical protein
MSSYNQTVASIERALLARVPLMVWGPSGVGKSAAVKDVAMSAGIGLIDIRASQTDPVDWRGIPSVDGGFTRWNPPSFLPKDGRGILFLDELSAAAPAVQVALYQLLLDRALGEYRLPDGWHVVGAGNRAEDRAVSTRMSSALGNRLCHITMSVDADGWLNWYWDHPLSDLVETVGFFIAFRRELLHAFDPSSKDLAFPTPRSWEMVAKLQATNLPADIEAEIIGGTIGMGAAAEYLAFCRIYRTLPNLDGILLDPAGSIVPEEPSARAATVAGLAKKAAPSNVGAILQYCGRMSREMEFMAMHLCRRTDPEIEHTKDVAKWMAKNNSFLMAH